MKLLIVYLLGTMLWAMVSARRGRSPRPALLLLFTVVVSVGFLSQRLL